MDNDQRFARLEAASIDAAQSGLKALLLLNSGACVVILGFISSTINQDKVSLAYSKIFLAMNFSLIFFAAGAVLSVFTSLLSYLTNQAYASSILDPIKNPWTRVQRINNFAVVTAILSLVSFCIGVLYIWRTSL